MINTNTETWGNIELPGLSDEELLTRNWESVARNRERNKNPEYWKQLEKGLEYRSNTSWKENNKKANQVTWKKPENIKIRKQAQRKLNGFPVCAIEPNGVIHIFNSIAECCEKLNNWVLQSKSSIYFPIDGSHYTAQRKKWKGWTFYRIKSND